MGDQFYVSDELTAQARRRLSDTRGSMAVRIALIVPAVILLGVGAADLYAAHRAQERLQDIADTAALAAAPALVADGAAAKQRASAVVARSLADWDGAPEIRSDYQLGERDGQAAIHVVLRGRRDSFLANMLPPGGWNFAGDATATAQGLTRASTSS